MIGSALFFILGFLAAMLLALLLAPAYRRRTVSLTRRRIEATVPLTREEILAEKDRLRAGHAMEVRRIELAAKALRETNAVQLVELGRSREALAQTSQERLREGRALADAEGRIAALEAELARATAAAAETEGGLVAAQAAMAARGKEIEAQSRQLEEAVLAAGNRQVELLAAETEIARLQGELETLKSGSAGGIKAAESAMEAGSAAELEALGRQLEETLLVSSGRQIELVARETEIERLNGDLADLRAEMAWRLGAADEAVASLRADRDPPSDMASVSDRSLVPDEEKGRLQERLTLLMRENRRLKDELAELQDARPPADGIAGDDRLRDRLAAMAAQVAALAAAVEGPASPIHAIIEAAPPGSSSTVSLADRIRALQRATARSEPAEAVQGHG